MSRRAAKVVELEPRVTANSLACDIADRLDALRTLLSAGAELDPMLAVLSDARRLVSEVMDLDITAPTEVRQ